MSATAPDFIRAAFSLRDRVVLDDDSLNVQASSSAVPVPAVTVIGSRIRITEGQHTDYYRVTSAQTGIVVGSLMEWVAVGIAPKAVRAYSAAATVAFEPYAAAKANIPTQTTKVSQGHGIDLLTYFEMIGGQDSDLSFSARAGGPQASLAVSGTVLTLAGKVAGSMSATVTAFDRAQGRPTETFRIVVGVENRAPASSRAIGNPSIRVGQTVTYDLDDYFSDPDGDALSYTFTGVNASDPTAAAGVSLAGSVLSVAGQLQGTVTLVVTATDQLLTISQQVHVTVPANQRPIIADHLQPQGVALGGQPATVQLDDFFRDPDGTALGYTIQWEEGAPADQYRQEVWYPHTTSGSSGLTMDSAFPYPPGSGPPWGSGSPWTIPHGTPFVQIGTYGGVLQTTRRTTHGARAAGWDSRTRKVRFTNLVFTDANPAGASSTDVRGLFGPGADVAWPSVAGQVLSLAPGESPGHRTLYVEAWDVAGLAASQFAVVSLGRPPARIAVPDQALIAGADAVVRLDTFFSDPDGDALVYTLAVSTPEVVTAGLVSRQVVTAGSVSVEQDLHLHGLGAGTTNVTVTATDPIGLAVSATVAVTVTPTAVSVADPLVSVAFVKRGIPELFETEGEAATVVRTATLPAFPVDSWRRVERNYAYGPDYPTERNRGYGPTFSTNDPRYPFLLALVESFDGYSYVPHADEIGGWTPKAGIRSGPASDYAGNVALDSSLPIWARTSLPAIGDSFFPVGYEQGAVIITNVSVRNAYISDNPRRISIQVTLNQTITAALGQRWSWAYGDWIAWKGRETRTELPVRVVRSPRTPSEYVTYDEFLASDVLYLVSDTDPALTTPGTVIEFQSGETATVDNAILRRYRGSPLFWEAKVSYRRSS